MLLRKALLVHFIFCCQLFCITSFGVCSPPKQQEPTKQTKANNNKNESFARRYLFLFLPIRSLVPGYQVEKASHKTVPQCTLTTISTRSPAQSQSGEYETLKNRPVLVSMQSCEGSMQSSGR